ncbi:hypothetical protein [Flavobacterium sp. XGLA_31]|uniref:hypothetical protein n=1 Tax=Flavobacterium sp. XGLA_31 TaxID=3447666 RepID=UPI003F36D507
MSLKHLLSSVLFRQCQMVLLCLVVFYGHEATAQYHHIYYVNDTAVSGDIYTIAIGNDANDGLSSKTPLLSITIAYQKANQGDTIYVDTGRYAELDINGILLIENKKKITFIVAGKKDEILSKKPFPTDEKVTPSIFYIVNDKPVEREVYLQHEQSKLKGH